LLQNDLSQRVKVQRFLTVLITYTRYERSDEKKVCATLDHTGTNSYASTLFAQLQLGRKIKEEAAAPLRGAL